MTRGGPRELERLAGLAAARATSALGQLAGCRLAAREPRPGRILSGGFGPWETGLFVEVGGALSGVVGLLLSPGARPALTKALLRDGDEVGDRAESALRELGNIVASQAISALADELGRRLLPSVPILASRGAEAALAALVRRRGAPPGGERIECLLEDRASGLRVLLVLALDGAPDGGV